MVTMEGINIFFKKEYTEQEMSECFEWFEQNKDRLPRTLEVGGDMKLSDVPATVQRMIRILQKRAKNHTIYSGFFANLLFIRHEIEKQFDN